MAGLSKEAYQQFNTMVEAATDYKTIIEMYGHLINLVVLMDTYDVVDVEDLVLLNKTINQISNLVVFQDPINRSDSTYKFMTPERRIQAIITDLNSAISEIMEHLENSQYIPQVVRESVVAK